jgi:Trypsin-co-occurring domain 1
MSDGEFNGVLVPVVDVRSEGEIGWGSGVAQQLQDRLDDVRQAIVSGSEAVARGLPALPSADGWSLSKVSASFGITLAAGAGVILTKASAEATFEVAIEFTRREKSSR